jgi:transcriptional regulator with XRE-family HTH domain
MSEGEAMYYGRFIRDARERKGLSLRDAAAKAGITEGGLGKIERDENGVTIRTLQRLAEVYGVPVGDLLPHTEAVPHEDLNPIVRVLEGFSSLEKRIVMNAFRAYLEAFIVEMHREGVRFMRGYGQAERD